MIRSEAVSILSRRLNMNAGRAAALAQRCADAGLLQKARGRAVPPLRPRDFARLFLATVVDRGMAHAAATVTEFEALETKSGILLGDVIANILSGLVEPITYARGGLIFHLRPASATLMINDARLNFGNNRVRRRGTSPFPVLSWPALRSNSTSERQQKQTRKSRACWTIITWLRLHNALWRSEKKSID